MVADLATIEYENAVAAGGRPPVTVYVAAADTLLGQYVIAPTLRGEPLFRAAASPFRIIREVTDIIVTGYTEVVLGVPGPDREPMPTMFRFAYHRDESWEMMLAPYITAGEGTMAWDDTPHRWSSDNPDDTRVWEGQCAVFAAYARSVIPPMNLPVEVRWKVTVDQMRDLGVIVAGSESP